MKLVKTVLAVLLLAVILVGTVIAVPSATITEQAAEQYEEMAFGEE